MVRPCLAAFFSRRPAHTLPAPGSPPRRARALSRTAAGRRSRARRGCRQTWLSLYRRPKRPSIKVSTRDSVHSSVRKPAASAARVSVFRGSRRCTAWSPASRQRRRARSASGSPCSSRSFQVSPWHAAHRRGVRPRPAPRQSQQPTRSQPPTLQLFRLLLRLPHVRPHQHHP